MAKEEIIYQQSRVALVDQNQSNYDENQMIYGTISIVKSRNKYCFRYSPSNLRDSTSEDWAMVQEGSSSVSFKQNGTDSSLTFQSSTTNHRFQFDLNQIKTFQRQQYLPEKTLGQVTIQLKDGKYLPTMLFYLGGSKKLMNCIEHHSSLKTSTTDPGLLRMVQEVAEVSVFDQMNLFDDYSTSFDNWGKVSKKRRALDQFARVKTLMKDALLGQNEYVPGNEQLEPDIAVLMESFNNDIRESNRDGFEVIFTVDFKNLPNVNRLPPISETEWEEFFDDQGRLKNIQAIRERIFRSGLKSNQLRQQVWKYLLNYYPWNSTREQRAQIDKLRNAEYFTMKVQWKSMSEVQIQRNTLFRDRKSLIDKDVARTDRNHEYFEGENNVHLDVLHDILMTYNMYNFDLGYVQGMNDLLSPILIVMENEVDSFWCFVGLMDRMEKNFHMDQSHIKKQLSNLHTLLQFVDAELANYLAENNSSNMYFFFRWMLICFKREFSFEDVMYLWEVLWTDYLSTNFELLVCLAILMSQKNVIMESKFGFSEILKHINELSLKVPVEPLLKHAEGLFILFQEHDQKTPGLPPSISAMVFPKESKAEIDDCEEITDIISSQNVSACSSSQSEEASNNERKPRTRKLTESHTIDENDSAVVSLSTKN